MLETKINIPRISVLEVELIMNKGLLENGLISEVQYHEVCKIIYEKINQLKSHS